MRIVSDHGSGPTVLCLHGSPTAPSSFEGLAARLAESRRVLVGALPGYAGVPALSPYDFGSLYAGIEATLLAEAKGPCDLLAFSMGTYHAFAIALRGRVPVRSIACLGAHPGVGEQDREALRGAAAAIRAGLVGTDVFAARMLAPDYLAAHPQAVATMQSWLDATTVDVVADELAAFAAAPNLLSEIPKLDARILARVGALDVATPPALSEAVVQAARSATLEIVPGVGHALLIEDGPATERSVLRFLDAAR